MKYLHTYCTGQKGTIHKRRRYFMNGKMECTFQRLTLDLTSRQLVSVQNQGTKLHKY